MGALVSNKGFSLGTFIEVISFNPRSILEADIMGNLDPESLNHLPKVAQLLKGEPEYELKLL